MIKFYDKLYVGYQKERYSQTEDQRILGFATPYEDNVAGKKRMASVDNWRDKKITPKIIENKPMMGFKICDFASRYSTSNKLLRIYDPRGFELEISIGNAVDLIKSTVITNGEIMAPLVWGRDSGNYLVTANHPDYVAKDKPKTKQETGQFYIHASGTTLYRLEGSFYSATLKIHNDPQILDAAGAEYYICGYNNELGRKRTINGYYYNYSQRDDGKSVNINTLDIHYNISHCIDDKPALFYSEFYLDGDNGVKNHYDNKLHISARRTKYTDLKDFDISELDENGQKTVTAELPDILDCRNFSVSSSIDAIGQYWRTGNVYLFKTKAEALAFVPPEKDILDMINYYASDRKRPNSIYKSISYQVDKQ